MSQVIYDTVIIGAGISGLKAGIDLNKAGLNTLILEARDRLGGRLYTKDLDGFAADLGASWFHDCLNNPLFTKYAKSQDVKIVFDDSHNKWFGSKSVIDLEILEPIVEEFFTYIRLNSDLGDDSLHNWVNRYLLERSQYLSAQQIEYAPQLARYVELWVGSCWDQSSGIESTTLEHQGRDAFVISGYSSVYQSELKEYPKERILKNKLVHRVERDANGIITVKCKDSTTYRCRYLVCSIPQSCLTSDNLKTEGSIEWVPQLPYHITNYFPKVSFSALGKVVLKFDKISWTLDDDRFWFLSDPDWKSINHMKKSGQPLRTPILQENSVLPDKPQPWQYPILFINVARFTKTPILILLIQAPVTQYIEAASDEQVWEYFKSAFSKISTVEQDPTKIVTTEWTQDPLARGSYCGVKVGADTEGAIALLVKGTPNVRFAGEHTVIEGNGCAHGAWVSGQREAAYILSHLHKKPNL